MYDFMDIKQYRERYPEYNDMSDTELAEAEWKANHRHTGVSFMEFSSDFLLLTEPQMKQRYEYRPDEDPEFQAEFEDLDNRFDPVMGTYVPHTDIIQATKNAGRMAKRIGLKGARATNSGFGEIADTLGGMLEFNPPALDPVKAPDGYEGMALGGLEPDPDMLASFTSANSDPEKYNQIREDAQAYTDKFVDWFSENADFWDNLLQQDEIKNGTPEQIQEMLENVGAGAIGSIPGIIEFMLNVPWAAMKASIESSEEGLDGKEAMKKIFGASLERFMIGRLFHYIDDATKLAKTSIMGTTFATQTYFHSGGDWQATWESFGTGLVFGAISKKTENPKTIKDLYKGGIREVEKTLKSAFTKKERGDAYLDKEPPPKPEFTKPEEPPLDVSKEEYLVITNKEIVEAEMDRMMEDLTADETPAPKEGAKDSDRLNVLNTDNVNAAKHSIDRITKAQGHKVEKQSETVKKANKYGKEVEKARQADIDAERASANEIAMELTGKDLSYLEKLHKDTENLASKLVYWRQYLSKLSDYVIDLAEIATKEDSSYNLSRFWDRYMHMVDTTSYLKSATANVARGTASGNIKVNGERVKVMDLKLEDMDNAEARIQITEGLEVLGGTPRIKKIAEDFLATKPKELQVRLKEAEKFQDSRIIRAFVEMRTANLLSSIGTYVVNTTSNILRGFVELGEEAASTVISKVFMNGKGMQTRELAIRYETFLRGMYEHYISIPIKGIGKGFRASREQGAKSSLNDVYKFGFKGFEEWAENISLDPRVRTEEVTGGNAAAKHAMSKENLSQTFLDPLLRLGADPDTVVGNMLYKVIDTVGAANRSISYGVMNMADAAQKTVAIKTEARGLLMRRAIEMKMNEKEALEFVDNTTELLLKHLRGEKIEVNAVDKQMILDLRESAILKARELVWQKDLGEFGRAVEKATNVLPALKIIIPFVKTPTNIAKFVGQRTPLLRRISKDVRARLKSEDPIVRAKAHAEVLTGVAMYSIGVFLWQSGQLTGSHDPQERQRKTEAGIPEYAIKVWDTWYQYNRFDPFGMFLGLAGDIATVGMRVREDDWNELSSAFIMSFTNNMLSKTYFKSAQDLALALAEPKRRFPFWLKSQSRTFLPASGLAGSINDISDPNLREVNTLVDTLKQTYASQLNNQKLSWMGTPVEKYDAKFRMFTGGRAYKDKTETSLIQKVMDDAHVYAHRTPREILGVELEPEQEYEILRILGEDLQMEERMNEIAPELAKIENLGLVREVITNLTNKFYQTSYQIFQANDPEYTQGLVKKNLWDIAKLTTEYNIRETNRRKRLESSREITKQKPPKYFNPFEEEESLFK